MLIHYRGLVEDRFDTPFGLGTLVWAKDCHHHCKGCFHQDRFNLPILVEDSRDIIEKILENPFTNGVVLGGFEWLEQYEEALAIIEEAISSDLEVILYTHYTKEDICTHYSRLLNYKGIYIKCGEYDNTRLSATYTSYGVPLASTNQIIYRVGEDIGNESSTSGEAKI